MKLMSKDTDTANVARFLTRLGYPEGRIVRALIHEGATTEEAQEAVRQALDNESKRRAEEEV